MSVPTASFRPPTISLDSSTAGLLGFLRAMIQNPVSAIPQAAFEDPTTVVPIAGQPIIFISDEEILEDILVKRAEDFPKSMVDERILKPALGEGLITAAGDDWRWKRRLAAPYFTPMALEKQISNMTQPFIELAQTWHDDDGPSRSKDISTDMILATLEVINGVLFSRANSLDIKEMANAINDYLNNISWVIVLACLRAPTWLPHPGKSNFQNARNRSRQLAENPINQRISPDADFEDVCAQLIAANDPQTGKTMSHQDMVDMLLTLIAAGHETTGNALTWASYCLAEQPELQETLRQEILSVTGGDPAKLDRKNLSELKLVEAFLKETLRLYPPVSIMGRQTTKKETFGGKEYPPGTTLFLPVYAILRHSSYWEEPDLFNIDRFLGDKAKQIPRSIYLPFGAGPHICIGGTFAMMEMMIALATLLPQVRLSPSEDTHCEPVHQITLRPKGGMRLNVEPI